MQNIQTHPDLNTKKIQISDFLDAYASQGLVMSVTHSLSQVNLASESLLTLAAW
jgi:hypothetical protein